jgi:hypothetical protein
VSQFWFWSASMIQQVNYDLWTWYVPTNITIIIEYYILGFSLRNIELISYCCSRTDNHVYITCGKKTDKMNVNVCTSNKLFGSICPHSHSNNWIFIQYIYWVRVWCLKIYSRILIIVGNILFVSSYNEAPRLHNEKEPLYHGTCIFSSKSTMNIPIFTQPR